MHWCSQDSQKPPVSQTCSATKSMGTRPTERPPQQPWKGHSAWHWSSPMRGCSRGRSILRGLKKSIILNCWEDQSFAWNSRAVGQTCKCRWNWMSGCWREWTRGTALRWPLLWSGSIVLISILNNLIHLMPKNAIVSPIVLFTMLSTSVAQGVHQPTGPLQF